MEMKLLGGRFHGEAVVAATILLFLLLQLPVHSLAECTCDLEEIHCSSDKYQAQIYMYAAIASILVGGAIGVCIPIFGDKESWMRPGNNLFFFIKVFAAGVILATGFIHVPPDAFESLNSPCLSGNTWTEFPFTGFVTMVAAMGTLMIDAFSTSFYQGRSGGKAQLTGGLGGMRRRKGPDVVVWRFIVMELIDTRMGQVPSRWSFRSAPTRVISQMLELGIVVHSLIIRIWLGASRDPNMAKFNAKTEATMVILFAFTTPIGIGIGIGLSSVYKESSPTALIVEGIFNATSAGILIYMGLVDLLAADFMNPKMQSNCTLQMGASVSLFLGAGCMSLLAIWA